MFVIESVFCNCNDILLTLRLNFSSHSNKLIMVTKLIADAGSTKVDWCLIGGDGKEKKRFKTGGINALLISDDDLNRELQSVRDILGPESCEDEVYYYGAGCATPAVCRKIVKAFHRLFPDAMVYVNSDMLGAARALCKDKPGIACILGTGSNSCLYDGVSIINNVPSLGYVLGDEGSGAALGKRLLSDAFKGQLPEMIREEFLARYQLNLAEILEKVYKSSAPNRFLASLVPFIQDHIWNPYIYSLVREEFICFIKKNIAMYVGAHSLPVNFMGSIASGFEDILREAADSLGYRVGKVEKSPMDGLIGYHG